MAKFELFYPILERNEGGYSNKEGDSGGETWKGIARNYYPGWSGWSHVDEVKHLPDYPVDINLKNSDEEYKDKYKDICSFMNKHLRPIAELEDKVVKFYKSSQWDPIRCDEIKNQSIANYIADWGVNAGLSLPIKHVQRLLHLNDDGKVGSLTLSSINNANQEDLFNKLKEDRIKFYNDLVLSNPKKFKQFQDTWLKRANSFKFQA